MKKIGFSVLLCLLVCHSLWAQNFKASGSVASELFEGQHSGLTIVEGDMNKDGVNDLVVFAKDCFQGENFAFYFGDAKGYYTLFKAYEVGFYREVNITINDKGVARIQQQVDGGSDVFLFRYQDGDFRLIGGKKDRHNNEHYDISYNFLTGKMIRTDGEGSRKKSQTTAMNAMPVLRFGWFPLKFDMLDYLFEPNEDDEYMDDKIVMGIFRVMQWNEMLFWHFCDYENPYRDPGGGEDGWYAYDDYMSPVSYNYFATLNFTKQEDGSFMIEMNESSEDRSYEQEFNEDLSNVDEVLERTEIKTESSSITWLFKDGKFVVIKSEDIEE